MSDLNLYKTIIEGMHEGVYFVDTERTHVMHRGERIGTTITLGVTRVRRGDTVEELVRRADQLMYDGKRQGRNRVVFG